MYRVRTVITGLSGAPWLNTLFFVTSNPPGSSGALAARDKAAAFWGSIRARMVTACSITTSGEVDFLGPDDGRLEDSFGLSDVTVSGQLAGDPLPVATQAVLRIATGAVVNGRRLRGKIYVPGCGETDNSTGLAPGVTLASALNTAGALLLAAPADPALGVWHRPVVNDEGEVEVAGNIATATAVTGRGYWAILRSRRD